MIKYRIVLFFILLYQIPCLLFGSIQNSENDSLKALTTYRAGVQLNQNTFYAEALDSFLLSLELHKKLYNPNDYRFASNYNAIGIVYKNLGLTDLSIQYLLMAENNNIKNYGSNYIGTARVYTNIGNVYRAKLNYNEALRYYEQVKRIYITQDDIDYNSIATANYSIAEMNYLMYEYEKARDILLENMKYGDEYNKLNYYDLLGNVYQELKDFENASAFYKKAINLSKEILPENDIYIGVAYLKYASFLLQAGKFNEVQDLLNTAYKIISVTQKEKGEYLAEYYLISGTMYANKIVESNNLDTFRKQRYNNINEAIAQYKKALSTLNFPEKYTPGMDLDSLRLISKNRSIDLLKGIADNYLEAALIYEIQEKELYKNSITKALDYYEITSNLIQRVKKEITDDESKITLANLEESTLIKIIQASYRAYELNKNSTYLELAFRNAEHLKSGSLFEKLSNDEAMKNSLIPDSLLQLERKINSSITTYTETRYNESISENPDTKFIARQDSIIFVFKKQRTELNDFFEKNYSQYYNLKYTDNLLKIKDIQTKLNSDQILIEYILNDNDSIPELYTFIISKTKSDLYKQKVDNIFINEIDSVFHFMSSPRYIFTKNEDVVKFCVSSHNLYKVLIAPYKNEIQDKKITIIPDGILSYLSFDALLEKLPDTTKQINFNNLDYLIISNSINYSYSSNLLFNFIQKKRIGKKSILAFAPEYYSDTIFIGNDFFNLTPLPGTRKEVEQIASELKIVKFIGSDATESNFRKVSSGYDILHLAMHAFINDSLPALSQFAFTQERGKPLDEDGLLSTADIYNLDFNARLAVLSACNTGRGQLKKGEGVISLARGFLFAGCPSIVMTLWEVEDNSGTKIMSSFYKYLKKGKTKDEALRQAKLEYLRNANPRLAHPHYWLGFVSIGDNTPLFKSYDFYFFSLLILTVFGIIADQLIRIKKARKKRAEE
jgi:CHAT domain-containing protein